MSKQNRDNLLSALVILAARMQLVPDDSEALYKLERIYNYLEQQLNIESYEG